MPTMRAVRLHGPADLRLDALPMPPQPGPGQVLLKVESVGICGSDLHTFQDARIGDTRLAAPLVLGHEFAGRVAAVGPDTRDGLFSPLLPDTRVAVDPAQPCGHCESCLHGNPNLCHHLHFTGHYPDGGALCDYLLLPGATCFPLPPGCDSEVGALLETLGVALHAVDLARIRVGDAVAILGAGPIGLSILQVVRLTGAYPIFITDKFPWRLELARKFGATPIACAHQDPIAAIHHATAGRGVDVAIEAAWADDSVNQAAAMARLGGRVVIVGISSDDKILLKHSTARRKGLTIRLARRMKHTYERAIALHQRGAVDLKSLVTHRFPLEQTPAAFALNHAYQDNVVKVLINL